MPVVVREGVVHVEADGGALAKGGWEAWERVGGGAWGKAGLEA